MRAKKVTVVTQDWGERGTRDPKDKKSVVLSQHGGTLRKQQQSQMKRSAKLSYSGKGERKAGNGWGRQALQSSVI